MRTNYHLLIVLVFCLFPINGTAGDDVAMFGGTPSRNMVSSEIGLPSEWKIETGKNILWKQQLGSQSYGGPVVYKDKIYVGTNNEGVRNPKLTGDRGNIMVFRTSDGKFLWQAAHPKLPAGRVHDWPQQGICSGPLVEGDRLYYVSNRAELICADTEGFLDGENDGPFREEANTSGIDEDIIWKLDMIGELEVFPHNLAAGSPLMVDDLIFTVTGNGVDEGHFNIPAPFSASFLAVNKKTGGLVWEDASPGPNILHGSWSNPAYGVVNGEAQVIFPGGDGWIYALNPLDGNLLWKFDLNPKDSVWALGGSGMRNNIISTPVFYRNKIYVGVGQDPEHGEGPGNFRVIDATGKGDVTETATIWRRGGRDFNRSISTVAIKEGLLFVADLSGFLYCLDVDTGQEQWVYDTFSAIWGSPFVADGKVYLGDEDGDLVVLKAGREKQLISEINMGSSIYTTPVAKNGIIFIATRTMLFALKEGVRLSD